MRSEGLLKGIRLFDDYISWEVTFISLAESAKW